MLVGEVLIYYLFIYLFIFGRVSEGLSGTWYPGPCQLLWLFVAEKTTCWFSTGVMLLEVTMARMCRCRCGVSNALLVFNFESAVVHIGMTAAIHSYLL